ncbi:MAG TPA: 2-isopropylmalate synthase [Kofleriaceae bacterium]|nr:2-isopropylmalate synthase [Kofleriaceae bacterium]
MASAANYVRVFDTTLRDGEQSPGATMNAAEKLEVARALARLGVDVIEAGFPAASPDDLAAVKRIAELVGKTDDTPSSRAPIICGLARTVRSDIDKAWQAVAPAQRPRIHTFLATSDIHLEHKLRMTRDEVLARIEDMVAYARSLCDDVEFSPEDAGRTEPAFLYRVLERAITAGATTLNIPDTVGYTTPDEFGALIAGILENVPGIDGAVVSVHCHDDLGLATANSLAALRAGARQVEVAVNGIGERAGNTALEEIVMALATRRAHLGLDTGVDTRQIVRTSKIVAAATGMSVPPNKAVVGANAFAHESGIHQDGVLKNQDTYEIMRPETVGASATRLVLGKHSGRHAVRARLAELGYDITGDELDKAFARFKELADRKKTIADADLEALVTDEIYRPREIYSLDTLQVTCGTGAPATATVKLVHQDGTVRTQAAVGDGPVHAAFEAIAVIVGLEHELCEYSVQGVTEGIDALGRVEVRIGERDSEATFRGHGAHLDIVMASAHAYLAALNRLLIARAERKGTTSDGGQQPVRAQA